MSELYLQNIDDGLPMRESGDYAKAKLKILDGYIERFIVSQRNREWRAFCYIDLFAGPGKNIFDPSKNIMLGSPLISMTAKYPFTNYYFVEMSQINADTLQMRVNQSEYRDRAHIFQADCNIAVDKIVDEINEIDRVFKPGVWSSLNLAFIDPEGTKELKWQTIEKLGRIGRMDMIIHFSTSSFTRNARTMIETQPPTSLDEFFGTVAWRDIYRPLIGKDNSIVRRAMLDFYRSRLNSLGYELKGSRDIDEKVFRNRKNAQLYTLIFASKHDLGVKFWNDAVKDADQPRLF